MTAAPAPQKPQPPKFNVSKGLKAEPVRLLIYAPEGIGKTTFAAESERPLVLDIERGSGRVDVARLDDFEDWPRVLAAVTAWASGDPAFAEYRTLVIDTLDKLEQLIWSFICQRDGYPNVEGYGYGKGFNVALEEWRKLLSQLERLRTRGVGVILVAHAQVKTFKSPDTDDYDRYQLKLDLKAAGMAKEWCDIVLFANFEQGAAKLKGAKSQSPKGFSTGARIIHTKRSAAWDAKTRDPLPDQLPLDGRGFWEALRAAQVAAPEVLRRQIEAVRGQLADAKVAAQVAEAVARAGDDSNQLSRILDRARARVQITTNGQEA